MKKEVFDVKFLKLSCLLLVFLFSISLVSAASYFIADIVPVQNQIFYDEIAEYEVVIQNSRNIEQVFTIVPPIQASWSFQTDPVYALSSFDVEKNGEGSFTFFITPNTVEAPGRYLVPVKIKSSTEEQMFDVELFIKNSAPQYTGYVPSLTLHAGVPEGINPSKVVPVHVELTNRNVLTINELVVTLEGPLVDETQTTSLGPLEKKTIDFNLHFSPSQEATTTFFDIKATADGYDVNPVRKEIRVVPYGEIEEIISTENEFFKEVTSITLNNKANVQNTHEVLFPTTFFSRFFTKLSVPYTVEKRDGDRYVVGSVTLGIQEEIVVLASKNYRPIFILLLLAVLGLGLYYLFRSPLTVKKKGIVLEKSSHGHVQLKITLLVKNRTRRIVDGVSITDKVPHVAAFADGVLKGTMRPDKVMGHAKHGTVLKWDVVHLEAFEERIITYAVRLKISILGNFDLPAASVRYKNQRHRFVRVYSNQISVGL